MEELKRIIEKVESHKLNFEKIKPYLKYIEGGAYDDVVGGQAKYYMYFPALMDVVKPKQVVELGSAAGASALMMLSYLPKDSMLYACSIPEPEGEFRFIKEEYPNLTLVRGDDLKLEETWGNLLPKLKDTDIFFIDTDHTYPQVHAELELYSPYFKKGALVFFDDIDLNDDMKRVWKEVPGEKLKLPDWHWSGFGCTLI